MLHAVRMPATEPFTDVHAVHVAPGDLVRKGQAVITLARPDAVQEVVLADAAGRVVSVAVRRWHMPLPDDELLVVDTADAALAERQQDEHGQGIHPEIARIMEESARQAIWEVEVEMKAAGEQWTREQIFARQQLRAIELFRPASNTFIASISENGWRDDVVERLDDLTDAARAIDARPAPKTSLDQLVDVWRRHPILVGWFGADLVHNLKRR